MIRSLTAVALACGVCACRGLGGGGGGGGGGNGGGGGGGGTQPSPATVDISGRWSGPASDSVERGSLLLQLNQDAATISGSIAYDIGGGTTRGGNTTGTMSGSSFSFTLNIGPNGGCPATVNGTAQTTSTSIQGTYSGNDCRGAVSTGQLSLTPQAIDLSGTWSGTITDSEAGAAPVNWAATWQVSQSGATVGGTATLVGGGTTRSGTLSGTVAHNAVNVTVQVGGSCPGQLVASAGIAASAQTGANTIAGNYTGSSCRGAITGTQMLLNKQ